MSEQDELARLCKSDSHWSRYFYGHDLWLSKALSDARSKNRVVFGAFQECSLEGDMTQQCLIACLFLKKSDFENAIEFKNLILPDYENSESVACKLIEKAYKK